MDDVRGRWNQDALMLGGIGAELADIPMPVIEVRLGRAAGEAALAAWRREDGGGELGDESPEQRAVRHRAAVLALIGAAVEERGRWTGDAVVVGLAADLVSAAVEASEDLRRTDGSQDDR